MRVMWLTDIHLNFLEPEKIAAFLEKVDTLEPDALLISGDIGDEPTCVPFLEALAEALAIPILFVLGNHDFYYGSIAAVRERVGRLSERFSNLHYLTNEGVIRLSESTAVIGHDSWADGRCGDFFGSAVALNDFELIEDLRLATKQEQLEKMQLLAEEGAAHLRQLLPTALELCQRTVIVTHVPPFAGATWHRGAISSPDWLPFFSCRVFGETLLEIADRYPDREITVLCGHTHSPGTYRAAGNVTVLTGRAVYGRPQVQEVFEWD